MHLYKENVTFPTAALPPEIRHSTKLYPYFKDCIGAIDGTHIRVKVPRVDRSRFYNRKGEITQNVLAICKFNLQFAYIYAGWEGSAHDARVLQSAISNDPDFVIPEGKYFLADAGYGLKSGCLTPYRGVRYHLREQAQANCRYVVQEKSNSLFSTKLYKGHQQRKNYTISGILSCVMQ